MAKSGKKTFRESTADYAALAARIAERRFEPLYLLMGDEPYFIDSLTARLADAILPPDERAFNQTVVYGKDTDAGAVIKAISPSIKGGGGGKAAMAQAGGKDASGLEAALEAARAMLVKA